MSNTSTDVQGFHGSDGTRTRISRTSRSGRRSRGVMRLQGVADLRSNNSGDAISGRLDRHCFHEVAGTDRHGPTFTREEGHLVGDSVFLPVPYGAIWVDSCRVMIAHREEDRRHRSVALKQITHSVRVEAEEEQKAGCALRVEDLDVPGVSFRVSLAQKRERCEVGISLKSDLPPA